ncbi:MULTISPECIES: methyl-accepting chemotaxis protein [unclassified Enterobacter]|uniref:methyl-accepting chemotaxis protein n=1 Tax=unclassified Enterobacter TaxID=2608935 RepID=UPI00160AFF8C|nr:MULTISPECIES: methyl-accepting chemotaxis protein [unclassified Enterobacter]
MKKIKYFTQSPPSSILANDNFAPDPGHNVPAYERIICSQLLKGVSTLEVVRDALLKSSEDLRSEQQAIDELNNRNNGAKKSLEDLVNLISQVDLSVGQCTDSLARFRLSFADINKYINEINQLSRQTNLIAINSAIEAAHVGNKGAGFSVIAKEIKYLSAQVNRSADNISSLTTSIEESAGTVCSVVSDMHPVIERINQDITHVVASIQTVIERSARMQSIISFISTLQFLNTVKLDHVIWKLQVYKLLLEKREDYCVNAHTDCRLGKWYYAGEGRNFSQHVAYRQLEEPHARVHSAGRQALEAFFNADLPTMEAELMEMEEASNRVVLLVETLATDIKC